VMSPGAAVHGSGDEAGKYRSADWWPGTTQSYEDMDRVALPVMTVTVE